MNRVAPKEMIHKSMSDTLLDMVNSVEVRYVIKLDEALAKRKLTQENLATITGIRKATISEFIKGDKYALNKVQLMAIMIALRISEMSELISIEFDPKVKVKFDKESEKWVNDGVYPEGWKKQYNDRAKEAYTMSLD